MKVDDVVYLSYQMIDMALFNGATPEEAEDVVQDVFLKLCEIQEKEGNLNRLMYKDEPNKSFLYTAIANRVFDLKRKQRMVDVDIDTVSSRNVTYQEGSVEREINEKLTSMGRWYHSLYHAYFGDDISIRKLSARTGISVTTLYWSLKHIKEQLKPIFDD